MPFRFEKKVFHSTHEGEKSKMSKLYQYQLHSSANDNGRQDSNLNGTIANNPTTKEVYVFNNKTQKAAERTNITKAASKNIISMSSGGK